MRLGARWTLRTRLTLWYVAMLAFLLLVYATLVFVFQYVVLTRQIFHDEVQDIVTVEGLLYFDQQGVLQLRQDYYSRPKSHLLVDRYMEVRDLSGKVLYRSPTLDGMPFGGPNEKGEGDMSFDERIIRLDDGSHVFTISHIHGMGGQDLLIRLGYSLGPLRTRMEQFFLLLLFAVPVTLGVAWLAGQTIARRALRPLEKMTERATGITARNLHDRLAIENPNDELGQMAQVFNHLLQRLEESFRQLQRFTADAAHELRTPLASLRTIGEVALSKGHDVDAYKEALGDILEETSRLNETIDGLILLSKAEVTAPRGVQEIFRAIDLMDEVLNFLSVVMDERNIGAIQENAAHGETMLQGDHSLLRIAFVNLVHNAVKFSPTGSTIRIAYSQTEESDPGIQIAIHDEGPGIAAGEHDRIFERFFTSSAHATSMNSGAGLGLSIAKLVVERAGGTVYFERNIPAGARCIVTLPTAACSARSGSSQA
ncbi:MAG: HAMP domain-containing protein [Acidobacteria bacterium]|nr:HAMP domain-containing protein [Acidobacteriota bacterium]